MRSTVLQPLTKLVLLVTLEDMDHVGKVRPDRAKVARKLGITHVQRVNDRWREAIDKGYLGKVHEAAWGAPAKYEALFPGTPTDLKTRSVATEIHDRNTRSVRGRKIRSVRILSTDLKTRSVRTPTDLKTRTALYRRLPKRSPWATRKTKAQQRRTTRGAKRRPRRARRPHLHHRRPPHPHRPRGLASRVPADASTAYPMAHSTTLGPAVSTVPAARSTKTKRNRRHHESDHDQTHPHRLLDMRRRRDGLRREGWPVRSPLLRDVLSQVRAEGRPVTTAPLQCEPTPLRWPELLAAARARGIEVWRLDEHGRMVVVESPPAEPCRYEEPTR